MFTLTPCNQEEEIERIRLRSKIWSGSLPEELYIRRNIFLENFYRTRTQILALRDVNNRILASMNILDIEMISPNGSTPAKHLASVIVEPALRKKGFASKMLELYFKTAGDVPHYACSEIDPAFYARFGFVSTYCSEVDDPANTSNVEIVPTDSQSFLDWLTRYRQSLGQIARMPTLHWLEFRLNRYLVDGENLGTPVKPLFGLVHGQHPISLVPDPSSRRLHVFWSYPKCPNCLDAAKNKARQLGLVGTTRWIRDQKIAGARIEAPIIRWPGESRKLVDSQLIDYW